MTKFLFFLAFTALLLTSSCKKDPQENSMEPNPEPIDSLQIWLQQAVDKIFLPGDTTFGTITGNKNNRAWISGANLIPYDSEYYIISGWTHNEIHELRETLDFFKVPLIKGKYKFKTSDISIHDGFVFPYYKRWTADGDAALVTLLHDARFFDNDYIEITDIDSVSQLVTGIFNVHLTDSLMGRPYPVYVHFSNGQFVLKMH